MNIGKKLAALALVCAGVLGAKADIAPFADNERIAFLGDSITAFELHLRDLRWFMARRDGTKSPFFLNCGTAGDSTADGIARVSYDLMTMDPDRVIVMFGMNDNAYGSWSGGVSSGHAERLAAYANNLRTLVETIRAAKPDMRIDLMTPSPYDEYSTDLASDRHVGVNSVGLRDFAAAVRTVAAEKGLDVIDVYGPMTAIEKAHPTGLHYSGSDRVHPGEAGSRFIAMAILSAAGELPGVELTVEAADELFAPQTSGNGLLLAQKLAPIGTEAYDHIRGLVYPDRFVPGWGGAVNLDDISSAADAVDRWCDAEIAKETPGSDRAQRLADIKVNYRSNRTSVPAYQEALDTATTAAIQSYLDERVVPAAVPAVPVLETIGYIHGKMFIVTTKATDFDSVEIQSKPVSSGADAWRTEFGWTKKEQWSHNQVGWYYSRTMFFPEVRVFRLRAVNERGASDWLTVSTEITATYATFGTATGTSKSTVPANAFDGDIKTLFEPDYTTGNQWCGQSYATSQRFIGARIVPRKTMADRAAKIVVEVADDADFTINVRQVKAFPTSIDGGAYKQTYEVLFDEPVTAQHIRLFKEPTILSLLDAEFIAADLPDTAKPTVTAEMATGGNRVTVSWTNPDVLGASSFTLERRAVGEDWTVLEEDLPGTTLSYEDTTVSDEFAYVYRVTGTSAAYHYAGQTASGESEVVSVRWGAVPVLSFEGFINGKLNVGVKNPTDGATTKWELQFRCEDGVGWTALQTGAGDDYRWNKTDARYPGHIFSLSVPRFVGEGRVRVRALAADGQALSSWAYGRGLNRTFALTGTTIKDGMSTNAEYDGRYAFNGDVNRLTTSEATGSGWFGLDFGSVKKVRAIRAVARFCFPQWLEDVIVQISDNAAFTNPVEVGRFVGVDQTKVNEIAFDEAIETRYIRVLRLGTSNNYLSFNQLEFTEEPGDLPAPVVTAAAKDGNAGIAVAWTNPDELAAGSFLLERKTDDGEWTEVADGLSGSTLAYDDAEATAGHAYVYRVTGVSARTFAEGTVRSGESTACVVPGGTFTWSGAAGDGDPKNGDNWEGGVAPYLGIGVATVVVPDTVVNRRMVLGEAIGIYGLVVHGGEFAFERGSGDGASLAVGLTGVTLDSGCTKLTVGVPVTVDATQTWSLGAAELVWNATMLAGLDPAAVVTFTGSGDWSFNGTDGGDFAGTVNVTPTEKYKAGVGGNLVLSGKDPFGCATLYVNEKPRIVMEGFEHSGAASRLGGSADGGANGHWYCSDASATNVFAGGVISDYQRLTGQVGTMVFEGGLDFGNSTINGCGPMTFVIRNLPAGNFLQVLSSKATWILECEGTDLGLYYQNGESVLDIRADWGYSSTKDKAEMTLGQATETVLLNGHPIRVRNLSTAAGSVISSDAPALVYANQAKYSGANARVTLNLAGDFAGQAGLSKSGSDVSTVDAVMSSTGVVEVTEGRLEFAATAGWPNATAIRVAAGEGVVEANWPVLAVTTSQKFKSAALSVVNHGKLEIPSGKCVRVASLTTDDGPVGAGVYTAATLPGVVSGGGSLMVGTLGLSLIVR